MTYRIDSLFGILSIVGKNPLLDFFFKRSFSISSGLVCMEFGKEILNNETPVEVTFFHFSLLFSYTLYNT